MGDTFDDLLREVGLVSAATQYAATTRPRRPLPRTMRPPEARAADPRLADAERERAFAQMEQRRAANADTLQRQAQGRGQNQFAEAGAMALEPTGIPGALRGTAAIREGDYRTAAMEGGLALLSAATLGPVSRTAAPRPLPPTMRTVARMEAPRPITPPPRKIGRASDGSVLPVAQARPFRRTAATSADLNEAARMQRGGLAVTQSPYAPRDAASPFAPRDLWQEGGPGRTGDAPMGPADTPLNFPRADEATRQLRALGRPFDLADLQDVQARVGLLSEQEMALLRSRVQSGQLQYAPPQASTPQPSRGGLALGQSPYAPRDAASPFAPRDAWQTNNRPDPHGEGVGADMRRPMFPGRRGR